jgi:predicted RNase H-like HicB family nuclease
MTNKVRLLPLSRYVDAALKLAEYERDEDGVILATVPGASGFFSQGDSFEEARENLRDAIEGNVLLALQLDFPIPAIEGVTIEEKDAESIAS